MRFTMKRMMIAVAGLVFVGAVVWGLGSMLAPRPHPRQAATQRREVAMSLDVVFQTCRLGTEKVRARNPFTGATMDRFDDPGLTHDERAAVAGLLRRMAAEGPDVQGSYRIRFSDGGEADLLAPGLTGKAKFDGCSVGTRAVTSDVVDFLFQLGGTGNMMIVPALEGAGTLVTSDAQRMGIAARYPDAKVVRSSAALREELRRGAEGAERYRKQVLEGVE